MIGCCAHPGMAHQGTGVDPCCLHGTHYEREAAGSAGAETEPHEHNVHDCAECFDMASEVLRGAAPRAEGARAQGEPPQALDVDVLTEALHHLHSIEFWKWWEPQPDGGAIVRSGPSPDFARVLAAAYAEAIQEREASS